jgi:hypothetical protein
MITVKIKNATIKSGDKYRKNQNYTMNLFKDDGVNSDTTIDEATDIINMYYCDKVVLTKESKVSITYNSL